MLKTLKRHLANKTPLGKELHKLPNLIANMYERETDETKINS